MTTTPILGLTDWAAAQASPWVAHNVALRTLEQGAMWFRFIDRDENDPSGLTPAEGDCYLIDGTGADDWTGHDDEIAFYINGAWEFIEPLEGMGAGVLDENVAIAFLGGSWVTLASGGSFTAAVASDIWTGTSTAVAVTPDALFDAAAPQTLTTSSNATPVDMAAGINFNLSLTEDSEIQNPSNAKAGQSGRIRVTDSGTGGWDLTFDSNWNWIDSDPTPITPAASEVHLFAYFANSSSDIEISYLGPLA